MNFDRAAAQAAGHGIRVTTVRGTDDVASAGPEEAHRRRGIAGAFFIIKIASAKAGTMAGLDEVTAAAHRVNANARTMGVGLSSCTVPAYGHPTFQLGESEMEIGLGLHGEPGRRRGRLERADRVVDEMMEAILQDLDYASNDVAILVNGLGGTPLEELYVLYRRAAQILDGRSIRIRHRYVGEFATSMEMAGASITLLRLDAEMHDLLALPVNCPLFKQIAS
jgi:dihydroxyacetone kinase-like protein